MGLGNLNPGCSCCVPPCEVPPCEVPIHIDTNDCTINWSCPDAGRVDILLPTYVEDAPKTFKGMARYPEWWQIRYWNEDLTCYVLSETIQTSIPFMGEPCCKERIVTFCQCIDEWGVVRNPTLAITISGVVNGTLCPCEFNNTFIWTVGDPNELLFWEDSPFGLPNCSLRVFCDNVLFPQEVLIELESLVIPNFPPIGNRACARFNIDAERKEFPKYYDTEGCENDDTILSYDCQDLVGGLPLILFSMDGSVGVDLCSNPSSTQTVNGMWCNFTDVDIQVEWV